jgi:hypothetical protein
VKHSIGALFLVVVFTACHGKHTVSHGSAGTGGGGEGGDGGKDADSGEDAAADVDADGGGTGGRDADAGKSGNAGHQAAGGMSGSCVRPSSGGNPGSGGRSGSAGIAIPDRGISGGVGGVRYPCPGDSMLRATPGTTDCGPTDCMSYPTMPSNQNGQPYCCAQGGYSCVSGNLGACESGPVYYCDEAADCDEGLHCCTIAGRTMFTCQKECEDRLQLCKTDAECQNGKACEPYNCGSQLRGLCGGLPDRWTLCSPLD